VMREAREKSSQLQTVQNEASQQKKKLEKERLARQSVYQKVSVRISRQRKEIASLKRNEKRLARLMEQLARMPPIKSDKPSATVTDDHSVFRGFKGHLHSPVAGQLRNRFGASRADGGLSSKGLFFAASPGTEVHAIAAGRVVYADWLRGFGNLLIVDHAEGYMSLYGNNEALLKQVGDTVERADAIATVGASGGNPDSGLYFELRHKGKPFDPLPWIAR
jgi:murein hydrolase activator